MKYESTRIKVLALCQQTLRNRYIFRSILAKGEDLLNQLQFKGKFVQES